MTWLEAIEAMRNGLKVRNQHFCVNEFFEMEDGHIIDEDGYSMAGWYKGFSWQDTGWSIVNG